MHRRLRLSRRSERGLKRTIDVVGSLNRCFRMAITKLPPAQLLALLQSAIEEAPPFEYQTALTNEEIRWLGRADALLDAANATPAIVAFRMARTALGSYSHSRANLLIPLHDAYSRMELLAPTSMRGSFIAGGDTWNGYAALVRLMQTDCDNMLVVDPYLNSSIFTDLAPHAAARVGLRCLAVKRAEYDPGLRASATKWESDPISARVRVEVRYSPPGALHDRLVIVDGREVWLISQSFKDIAKRSPASVSKFEGELASDKIEHYETLWQQGEAMTA
ncbi:hypothetical protein Bresu_0719 [Brevundimonas subvibrioides ATCC 15264]|uniref:Phospholipase D-like domain-containing protein n=1 Tax=Brevundimonas subvibrioides (strain ATCC 15264 / DSM 4735 / LMG 14903 / NBRC 16000 / CB 81) TaxID=633149 RepID=D9QLV0_BRESC|nr:hypothetical protein Bresu_0719 [Brevundimonas subvibrioides ATCC 15264]